MSTRPATVEFIVEQASGAGAVSARKMFGEYALYCDGKLVALVCDDELFVKPTSAGRGHAGSVEQRPPYPGAKPSLVIEGDKWEDREWISALIRHTADELPAPAPKRRKRPNAA